MATIGSVAPLKRNCNFHRCCFEKGKYTGKSSQPSQLLAMFVRPSYFLLLLAVLIVPSPHAFVLRTIWRNQHRIFQRDMLYSRSDPLFPFAVNTYFQLEELEDADRCTTEVFLSFNSSVVVTNTDGPRFIQASGNWDQGYGGEFRMILVRRYEGGREQRTWTDVGEFEYETTRMLDGQFFLVGDRAAVRGKIIDIDEIFADREVGFFEMIDTTPDKIDLPNGQ